MRKISQRGIAQTAPNTLRSVHTPALCSARSSRSFAIATGLLLVLSCAAGCKNEADRPAEVVDEEVLTLVDWERVPKKLAGMISVARKGNLIGESTSAFTDLLETADPFGSRQYPWYAFRLPLLETVTLEVRSFENGQKYMVHPTVMVRVDTNGRVFDRFQLSTYKH